MTVKESNETITEGSSTGVKRLKVQERKGSTYQTLLLTERGHRSSRLKLRRHRLQEISLPSSIAFSLSQHLHPSVNLILSMPKQTRKASLGWRT